MPGLGRVQHTSCLGGIFIYSSAWVFCFGEHFHFQLPEEWFQVVTGRVNAQGNSRVGEVIEMGKSFNWDIFVMQGRAQYLGLAEPEAVVVLFWV